MTFSQHVALHRSAVLYYIGLFTVVLPLLAIFLLGWFMPTFHLSWWFGFFVVVACTTQYACTFVPETGGRKTRYHRLLAGISAVSLLPPMGMVLFIDSITT